MINALKSGGLPFLLPMLLLSFGLFVVPFGVLAAYSLLAGDTPGLFGNYATFLGEPFNVSVVINTIVLAVKVTIAATLVATPIALLYWHSGPWVRRAVIFLTLMPLMTANVVRTFAWIALLGREGPIAAVIHFLGFTERPTTLLFTEIGLILAQTQIEMPLLVLPLIAMLSRLDTRVVEAAEMAGAGPWRILWTVLLPLALPGYIAGWILTFASATTNFVTQTTIGGARRVYLPQFVFREVGILFD
ncbi:MAG: ABC transporter permease, partial [Hyphomicrobiaceae bacterium]|nr:ABC transporter permease [Hyphomicrobiaceae bacterium]